MKKILVLGAGRSSSSLIRYILKNNEKLDCALRVADRDLELAKKKTNGSANSEAVSFNALDSNERLPHLEWADIIVSMLPARFHIDIARDCVRLKKNLITPSYVTPEMLELEEEAKSNGVIILNELGLDPGIDHMSAMKIIDQVKAKGGKQNSKYKFVPYNKLFSRTKDIEIENYGMFEGYANRDSLTYLEAYSIEDIPTIYRGTLRRKGYSEAWNVFVQLGLTEDTYKLPNTETMTYREFINFSSSSITEKTRRKINIRRRRHRFNSNVA